MQWAVASHSKTLPALFFSLLRLTGNYGDCLPEITTAADEDDEVGVDEGAYPTPNVTLHKSYTTTESACGEDEYLKLRIETDADNAVKRISYDVPYEEYQVEYDIVVGNEVIDEAMNHPEFPEEEKLYKYEIKNRTKTKIRDIVNPATIEITYDSSGEIFKRNNKTIRSGLPLLIVLQSSKVVPSLRRNPANHAERVSNRLPSDREKTTDRKAVIQENSDFNRSASSGIPSAARERIWVSGLRIIAVSGFPGSTRKIGTSGRT